MAELGNSNKNGGVRMRFGHPGISENAMGKKIGRGVNFRVQGDKLLHDVQLFDPARRSPVFEMDVVNYIFDMAEQEPEEIAESVVIMADEVWTLDDGREINAEDNSDWDEDITRDGSGRPVNATTPYPVIRPLEFYYADFVSEGALTHDGLFSSKFSLDTSKYAAQIFDVLDDLQATYGLTHDELRQKADELLTTYATWRDTGEITMPNELETQDKSTPVDLSKLLADSDATVASLSEQEEQPSETVSVEAFNAVVDRLNLVTEQNEALQERFEQLATIAQNQQVIINGLVAQRAKEVGEPVVTAQLGAKAQQFGMPNPLNALGRGEIQAPPAIKQQNETPAQRNLRRTGAIQRRATKIVNG
jgi:hypothetical protein